MLKVQALQLQDEALERWMVAQNDSIKQLWRNWCSAGGTRGTQQHARFATKIAGVRYARVYADCPLKYMH